MNRICSEKYKADRTFLRRRSRSTSSAPGRLLSVFSPLLLCGLAVANAEMLNSERIEQTFGSYGIEVLYSDADVRVSNLYSEDDGARTTRTLAVVKLPQPVPDELEDQHTLILAGASIGATFKAAGWTVSKRYHTMFTEVQLPAVARNLLEIEEGDEVAVHYYSLGLSKDDMSVHYGGIFELHHPDYLTPWQLRGLYGPWGEFSPAMETSMRDRLSAGLALLEEE